MVVIDANVAVEIAKDSARGGQFSEFVINADRVLAPALFISETANATWKHAVFGKPQMKDWMKFHIAVVSEVDDFTPDAELFPEALTEAVKHKHSVYDMLYFVLARRTASTLLTCDRRLAEVCKRNDVPCVELIDLYQNKL